MTLSIWNVSFTSKTIAATVEDVDVSNDDNSYETVIEENADVRLSETQSLNGEYSNLKQGETLQYGFSLSQGATVILRFNESTYGELIYRICNSEGATVFENTADLSLESKRDSIALDAGKYTLQVSSKNSYSDVNLTLTLAKRVYTKTLKGLEKYKANPCFGVGTWSSSNKNIVKLSSSSGATTTFIPVSAGKATITFKSGTYTAIYQVTVKKVTKTIKKKLTSCESFVFNPKQGKGTWTSGNRKIVEPTSKKVAKITLKAKEKGSTTVTFKSPLATYYYKVTVTSKKSYPIDRGYLKMNEDGGIIPNILISNNSNKTIKYVTFRVYYYNAVNDPVYYDGQNYEDLRYIGPLKPWDFEWAEWAPNFVSYAISKIKIRKATVIYMDGTQREIKVNRTFEIDWD